MRAPKQKKQRGFTLVELLIVVIILAILAAIVVPQFSAATSDAQESALDSNLSSMRSVIELYKVQHANSFPGANAATGGACTSKGTGAAGTAQAFIEQLTMATDAAGNTCATADTTYKFGPYLRKGVPVEPISQKGAVAAEILVTTTGAPIVATAAGGWAYDTKSGQILANSAATVVDSKGKPISTH